MEDCKWNQDGITALVAFLDSNIKFDILFLGSKDYKTVKCTKITPVPNLFFGFVVTNSASQKLQTCLNFKQFDSLYTLYPPLLH
jgi:hypothetical protein